MKKYVVVEVSSFGYEKLIEIYQKLGFEVVSIEKQGNSFLDGSGKPSKYCDYNQNYYKFFDDFAFDGYVNIEKATKDSLYENYVLFGLNYLSSEYLVITFSKDDIEIELKDGYIINPYKTFKELVETYLKDFKKFNQCKKFIGNPFVLILSLLMIVGSMIGILTLNLLFLLYIILLIVGFVMMRIHFKVNSTNKNTYENIKRNAQFNLINSSNKLTEFINRL